MKIVETIKKKYFPHKVKLVKGEQRTYLTELDKAFIYACNNLSLLNNRLEWYNPDVKTNWLNNYKANKYDFFNFNVEVQDKCWETGHLKEIIRQMIMKLSDAYYWKPFFELMLIFNHRNYNLGIKVHKFVKILAVQEGNYAIFRAIIFCLDYSYRYNNTNWKNVYRNFTNFFNYQTDDKKAKHQDSYSKNYYATVLGISPNSTKREIKAAYRKLVIIHHPDRGGKTEDFIKIQKAYEYLINN